MTLSLWRQAQELPGPNNHNKKIFLWKHVDIEEKKPDVLDFSTRFTTQYSVSTGVNELWDTLKDYTLGFFEDKVPSKMTSSRFSQPWIKKKVKAYQDVRRGRTREQNILAQTVISKGTCSFRRNPNMNVKRLTTVTSASS